MAASIIVKAVRGSTRELVIKNRFKAHEAARAYLVCSCHMHSVFTAFSWEVGKAHDRTHGDELNGF